MSWAGLSATTTYGLTFWRHSLHGAEDPPTGTYQQDGGCTHLVCSVASDPSARFGGVGLPPTSYALLQLVATVSLILETLHIFG